MQKVLVGVENFTLSIFKAFVRYFLKKLYSSTNDRPSKTMKDKSGLELVTTPSSGYKTSSKKFIY